MACGGDEPGKSSARVAVAYIRRVKIVLVPKRLLRRLGVQALVERVLRGIETNKFMLLPPGCPRTYNGQNDDPRQVELVHDGVGQRRLARARAAGDAYDTDIGPWRRIVRPLRDCAICLGRPAVDDGCYLGGHGSRHDWMVWPAGTLESLGKMPGFVENGGASSTEQPSQRRGELQLARVVMS